jgi:hypothetical protein
METSPSKVEITIMVVGGADGGKIEHGNLAYVEIRFKNVSKSDISIPFAPRSLGKGLRSQQQEPSYKADEYWWYSGFIAPQIIFQFEDSAGNSIRTNYPVMIPDIPKLAPGGWVTASCLFLAPEEPGKYNFRIIIDTSPLNEKTGYGLTAVDRHEVFIKQEILLKDLEVR